MSKPAVGCGLLALMLPCAALGQGAATAARRPVTVPDLIAIARIGSNIMGNPHADWAVISPDEANVATVVQRGNLANNTVEYALLRFRTAELFRAPRPDTLALFASSSNGPGIAELQWLDDRTLAFRGADSGEVAQHYTVDIQTRRLGRRALPPGATRAVGRATGPLLYEVASADTSDYPRRRQRGFVIPPLGAGLRPLADLLAGRWPGSAPRASRYFVHRPGRAARPIPGAGPAYEQCALESRYAPSLAPSLAPTGAVALAYCTPRTTPARWHRYTNAKFRSNYFDHGFRSNWPQYMLLDLERDTITPLIDAPHNLDASAAWAPDGRSIVLANALLPLDVEDAVEHATRAEGIALAEVDIHTGAVTVIARPPEDVRVLDWDRRTNTIELMAGGFRTRASDTARIHYQKTAAGWRRVAGPPAALPHLIIDEALDRAQRLVAIDRASGRRYVVLDPNPDLHQRLRFGRVRVVHWRTPAGEEWAGGLYYPPDHAPGRRYPLVIQAHGFDSTVFAPDGYSTSGYAAQPLAGHDILVLQVGVHRGAFPAPGDEGAYFAAVYEAAIAHLDSLGLVDTARLGLQGWSRSAYHAKYTLAHGARRYAAAMVIDGVDFGYVQHVLAIGSLKPSVLAHGGDPIGAGLETWRRRAPNFNLDRVTTPVHITAIQPYSILGEWETYAGLKLQGKPVEMLYLPEGAHALVRPLERLTSQQTAVDWFRFWLAGEEDPDPAKREQYARWRALRG